MRYVITSTKFTGEIEVRYNSQGELNGFDVRAILDEVKLTYFTKMLVRAMREPDVQVFKSEFSKIKMLPEDLSFDAFWNRYNYKVGHKKKAETMWNRMTDSERMKAIAWIPQYEAQIAFTRVAKLYPESYLSQKRYLQHL